MNKNPVIALGLLALSVSCSPATDSVSCNSAAVNVCATFSVSGGTFTSRSCGPGLDVVPSCATTNIVGRCALSGFPAGAVACPSGASCSYALTVYNGGDVAMAQMLCTMINGTWTMN